MQVVITLGGRGTRMGGATVHVPKPLLEAKGKTLIAHKLDMLPDSVHEIILIIGFHGELIQEKIGDIYAGRPVRYVKQPTFNGTAGALKCAEDLLGDEFIVMMGDDIYSQSDVEACIQEEWAICAKKIENKMMGGELLLDENQLMAGINEPRHFVQSGYINTGLYKLQKSYFDYTPQLVAGTTELGIPQTLTVCAKDFSIYVVITNAPWIQISNQEDLAFFNAV